MHIDHHFVYLWSLVFCLSSQLKVKDILKRGYCAYIFIFYLALAEWSIIWDEASSSYQCNPSMLIESIPVNIEFRLSTVIFLLQYVALPFLWNGASYTAAVLEVACMSVVFLSLDCGLTRYQSSRNKMFIEKQCMPHLLSTSVRLKFIIYCFPQANSWSYLSCIETWFKI